MYPETSWKGFVSGSGKGNQWMRILTSSTKLSCCDIPGTSQGHYYCQQGNGEHRGKDDPIARHSGRQLTAVKLGFSASVKAGWLASKVVTVCTVRGGMRRICIQNPTLNGSVGRRVGCFAVVEFDLEPNGAQSFTKPCTKSWRGLEPWLPLGTWQSVGVHC